MSLYSEYGPRAVADLNKTYNLPYLERTVKYLEEGQTTLQKYEAALHAQIARVRETPFHEEVLLEPTTNCYANYRREYRVTFERTPIIDGEPRPALKVATSRIGRRHKICQIMGKGPQYFRTCPKLQEGP